MATNVFFRVQIYYMLDIVLSCNPVQYRGKLMTESWENFGPQRFFRLSYHPMQFKRKLLNQTWQNGKKSPKIFAWDLPLLDVRHCYAINFIRWCKLSSYKISRKPYDPNSIKQRKTSFWAWFRHRVGNFFFNLTSPVNRYHD